MQTLQQFNRDLNASISLLDQVEAANIPSLQNRFFALGFDLVINYDLMTAKVDRLKSKARFPKSLFHYRYRNFANLLDSVTKWLENREAIKAGEDKRKAIKKDALQNMLHNFKVGGILYDSWGYDQTNIDFYQIIEVGAKSIKIRPIHSYYASDDKNKGLSTMSSYVGPVKDSFIGDEIILKKINALISYNGSISYYVKSKHGWISEHIDDSVHYSSWYA